MKFRVPIDFIVEADSPEEAKIRIDEFLLRSVTEYRLTYSITNYEAAYGYPVEPEVPNT